MQEPSRWPTRVLPVFVVTIALLTAASFSYASPGDEEIYRRSLTLGLTEAVKQAAETQPRGHQLSILVPFQDRAEYRRVPRPCGLRVAKLFRNSLRTKFGIVALPTCLEGDTLVECPSDLLDTERRTFLRLTYKNAPGRELFLDLSAFQRSRTGGANLTLLSPDQKLTFAELWEQLVEVVQCEQ